MNLYICKCGKTFKKSTNAATTGYVLENYKEGHECYGCPFIVEHEDWITKAITKRECRGTPTLKYRTYDRIGTQDKDFTVCSFYTLDLDFAKSVYEYCSALEGYTGGKYSDKWRAADFSDNGLIKFVLNFAMNKKGTNSRRAVREKFFENIDRNDEKEKILNFIRTAINEAGDVKEETKMPEQKPKRKREFDVAITDSIKTALSGSFADNIKMIDIDKLNPHNENFYSISDIEILADDIERQGLKHNLVVSEDKNSQDNYFIISGERRYSAIKLLIEQGRQSSRLVPCYVSGEKSRNEVMYELIMLNATARKISDSELIKQNRKLTEVFKALEIEGKKIPGRLREKISETLKVSPSQIGKLENIENNAIAEVKEAVEKGYVSISTANEIAKLPESEQETLIKSKPANEIKNKDVRKIKVADYFDDDLSEMKLDKPDFAKLSAKISEAIESVEVDEADELIKKISQKFAPSSSAIFLTRTELVVIIRYFKALKNSCVNSKKDFLILTDIENKFKEVVLDGKTDN
jgi:ParB family chromosome partitioning protein